MANMDIWNRNCKTEKKYTKTVPKGGFNLTAIDAQYQLRMATEEFGAMGSGFGVKDEKFQIHNEILFYQATFWWFGGDLEKMNEFAMFADIAVQANRDICKKVQTDALTKALSRLGFNADVFLNEFDGNTYTDPVEPTQRRQEPRTPQPVKDAGVEFEPVTEPPESAADLPAGMSVRSKKSATKIIACGRECMDDKSYYEELFTYNGKCFVHNEADFIKNIEYGISQSWDTDPKFYVTEYHFKGGCYGNGRNNKEIQSP